MSIRRRSLSCALLLSLGVLLPPTVAQAQPTAPAATAGASQATTPPVEPYPPRTLEGYVVQEKDYWDYLLKNHPVFKSQAAGRIVGEPQLSDRGEEFVEFGGGKAYAEKHGRPTAMTYRLGAESFPPAQQVRRSGQVR